MTKAEICTALDELLAELRATHGETTTAQRLREIRDAVQADVDAAAERAARRAGGEA